MVNSHNLVFGISAVMVLFAFSSLDESSLLTNNEIGGWGATFTAHAQTSAPLNVTISLGSNVTDPTSLDEIPFTVSFSKPISEFELASVVTSSGVPQDLVFELAPYAHFTTRYPYYVETNFTGHIFTRASFSDIKIWDSDYNLLASRTLDYSPSDLAVNSTGHMYEVTYTRLATSCAMDIP